MVSEIDPNTKNSDKKIKVIKTGRNRPAISFGLIDEDAKDVDIDKYDIQVQYTDILERRLNSYRTWVEGIKHKTPIHPESQMVDGFKIEYSGEPKNRVEAQSSIKELNEGTYYIRVKAYDLAGNSVNSKEVKLVIGADIGTGSSISGSLTLSQIGAITYDPKYSAYYYNSNLLTLRGQSPAGSQVDLYIDNAKAAQVNAGGDGLFSLNHSLPNGTYNIKLQQGADSIAFTLYVDNTSSSFPDFIRSLLGL